MQRATESPSWRQGIQAFRVQTNTSSETFGTHSCQFRWKATFGVILQPYSVFPVNFYLVRVLEVKMSVCPLSFSFLAKDFEDRKVNFAVLMHYHTSKVDD